MKKYWILGLGLGLMSLTLGTVVVFAQSASLRTANIATTASPIVPSTVTGPMVIHIEHNGNVLLRGEVTSVGLNSLVVESWGMDWKVKVSTTQIMSANRILNDIAVGDFVGVLGNISEDGTFVIDARIVRKWGPKRMDNDKDGVPDDQDNDHNNDGKHDMEDSKGERRGWGQFIPVTGRPGVKIRGMVDRMLDTNATGTKRNVND